MTMLQAQKMYEKHPLHYLVCRQFLLPHLDRIKWSSTRLFGQSSQVCLTYRKLNKSTMNNIHLEVFMDVHWSHLFMSVFRKAILLKVIDQKDLFYQEFSECQHSKKHTQHEIQHLVYHQMNHQNFYILKHTMLPCFDRSYRVHLKERDKKLHSKKILYQLLPIYHQRMNHLAVEVLKRIE